MGRIMDLEIFVQEYWDIYKKEVEILSKSNPDFKSYAIKLFNDNLKSVKDLHKVYLNKEVSSEELRDAFRTISLYCFIHFEKLISFPQVQGNKTTNNDIVAFMLSEGKGSRLSLMGLNTEKAMLEMPSANGFSPLVQLAYDDLRVNGIKTVFTTSDRTRPFYNVIFGKEDNIILTEKSGNNKHEALVECVKSLDSIPTAIFRTCGDTLRDEDLLRLGMQKYFDLPNPEDYIVVLAKELDSTKKNGLSSVSVKTDGDVAIQFTKSPSILPGDNSLLYKVGSLIGKNCLSELISLGNIDYNTFCNNLQEGKVLVVTTASSKNKGIDDVFDLRDYAKEMLGVKSIYDAVKGRYWK
ncbi:MAG: hypothetical protein Q8R18_04945 [bacterium]|nr:hypothetical protein [bacterium]